MNSEYGVQFMLRDVDLVTRRDPGDYFTRLCHHAAYMACQEDLEQPSRLEIVEAEVRRADAFRGWEFIFRLKQSNKPGLDLSRDIEDAARKMLPPDVAGLLAARERVA